MSSTRAALVDGRLDVVATPDYEMRPLLYFVVDAAEVFANNAYGQQLYSAEKEDDDDRWGPSLHDEVAGET